MCLCLLVERFGGQVDAAGPYQGSSLRVDGDLGKVGGVVQWRQNACPQFSGEVDIPGCAVAEEQAEHAVTDHSDTLHRIGFSPQVPRPPGRGAGRGGDRRIAGGDLGKGTKLAAATGAWICFEDEAGQTLRPPKARTWSRCGQAPVILVSGKGSGRVSWPDLPA